jgi:hypothetical protein
MKPETVVSVTTWADDTFGPATLTVQLRRAYEEMDELATLADRMTLGLEPDSPAKLAEEAADIVICLYRFIGHTDPLAIEKKMAINRKREWKVDGSGCAQHVVKGGQCNGKTPKENHD